MLSQRRINRHLDASEDRKPLLFVSAILGIVTAFIALVVDRGFSPLMNFIAGFNMLATARDATNSKNLNATKNENEGMIQYIQSDIALTLERIFGYHPPLDISIRYAPSSVTGLADYEFGTRPTKDLLFNELNQNLLILGAKGSGKSVLLLQYAQYHMDRAVNGTDRRIPIVFNLSTWSLKRQNFAQWATSQLTINYHIPKKTALEWLEKEKLFCLLDGLDEVNTKYREGCVQAINNFCCQHPLIGIIVCCELEIYQALGNKLRMRDAIILDPLIQAQIDSQIDESSLVGLSRFLQLSGPLRTLAETPFMLNAMKTAFSNVSFASLKRLVPDNINGMWCNSIIQSYVELRVAQAAEKSIYTPSQIRNNLLWLAEWIQRHQQNIVYLEEAIQPDNLKTGIQRLLYRCTSAGLSMLIIGSLFCVFSQIALGSHFNQSIVTTYWIVCTLMVGIGSSLRKRIKFVDTVHWTIHWKKLLCVVCGTALGVAYSAWQGKGDIIFFAQVALFSAVRYPIKC